MGLLRCEGKPYIEIEKEGYDLKTEFFRVITKSEFLKRKQRGFFFGSTLNSFRIALTEDWKKSTIIFFKQK